METSRWSRKEKPGQEIVQAWSEVGTVGNKAKVTDTTRKSVVKFGHWLQLWKGI